MALDLVVKSARISGVEDRTVDIGVCDGRITAIEPSLGPAAETIDANGALVTPGFVDTHIHLDKSCVIDRCTILEGTLQEAIRETARVKREFTVEDIAARARRTLEKAILAGTMHMRTHVEIDPRIGMKGFEAVKAIAAAYRWAIDVEICVFPQEGMLNDPGTEELLVEACYKGADLIGGCPYADTQPYEQMARIFSIAQRFNLDIDFHLDFDLDTTWDHVTEVCRLSRERGWQNRVAVGHATKLSAMPPARFAQVADELARSGVAVTVLPATDLFLMGRGFDHNVPRGVTRADLLRERGVTCSLATNNVLNAFTPFGDCSLGRIANLYANVAQLVRRQDLSGCLDMITSSAAKLMNLPDYGILVGAPADFLLLPTPDAASAVAEIVQPVLGIKAGRQTFRRAMPELLRPPSN